MPKPTPSAVHLAFASHADEVVNRLAATLCSDTFRGVIPAAEAEALAGATSMTVDELMLALAKVAGAYAVAPVSRFFVGAVARGGTGSLYLGSNLELSGEALNLTVHAEQSAVTNAWIGGEERIESIAVTATPCGYCRQYLWELTSAQTLRVIVSDEAIPLWTLLPRAFGPRDLSVEGGLLTPQSHGLRITGTTPEPIATAAALAAANRSYAPYTKSYSGVAIITKSNIVAAAPYSENAAFNPSFSPACAALSQLNLAGAALSEIRAAILVEVENPPVSQLALARAALASAAGVPVSIRYAIPPRGKSE
ncbi:MAG TPA: cytidine deaminase [Thermoanaerobaculia bacterium]|nr:cytidine deaminase [Thermoanaerobaculia bacterium]